MVWIRELPKGTPLSDAARRDLARPTRLRWLAGQQRPEGTWGSVRGTARRFADLERDKKTILGDPARRWLADLAGELWQCRRNHHVPDLELNRVWITSEGRAKLLDFPAPGTAQFESGSVQTEYANIEPFLGTVAWSALSGRVQDVSDALPITQPPLPASGTAVLRALQQSRDLQEVLDLCGLALQTRLEVPRWSRALLPSMILVAVLCVVAKFRLAQYRTAGASPG